MFATLQSALFSATTQDGVVEYAGRWYIQAGQPGFNSRANNDNGYASRRRAVAAIRYYTRRPNGLLLTQAQTPLNYDDDPMGLDRVPWDC